MKNAWMIFLAALPLGDETVLIRDGKAQAVRGRVRTVLLYELSELAENAGLATACIHGTAGSTQTRLQFFGVPSELRQRVRNVWLANCR